MTTRTVTLWYVIADTEGPARACQDLDQVVRFRRREDAEQWARGRTWEGRPCVVRRDRVPDYLARRWGCA